MFKCASHGQVGQSRWNLQHGHNTQSLSYGANRHLLQHVILRGDSFTHPPAVVYLFKPRLLPLLLR